MPNTNQTQFDLFKIDILKLWEFVTICIKIQTFQVANCNNVWQVCNRNTELDIVAVYVCLPLPNEIGSLRNTGG